MDVFIEKIVRLKRSPITKLIQSLIILGSAVIAVIISMFMSQTSYAYLLVAVCVVCLFFGWKFSSMFNIEYEYSLTNGLFEIDRIVNERKRKNLLDIECSKIESFKKYNPSENNGKYAVEIHAGNVNAENAYCFTYKAGNDGLTLVVFQPDDRLIKGMLKFIPRRVVDKNVLNRD